MKIQYIDKQGVETILKLLKNKISSIVDAVVFRGTVNSVADLPSLSDADIKPGDMYTVLTESQTTADFVEGAGETIDPYTEVVVVNQGTVLNPEYKWYVLGNVFTTKDKISYGQSLPSMPYDGMLFFYMGPDVTTPGNELYSNSFYAYNESENTWDYLWTFEDKIWRGTQAEWDALSAAEKDKYEQAEIIGLDNNGVVYVADKIEAGNMNPVTSNAVAKYALDWANAVDIAITDLNAGYTAPANGYIVGYYTCLTDVSDGSVRLSINNVLIANSYTLNDTINDIHMHNDGQVQCPIYKGNVLKTIFRNSGALESAHISFVPYK